MSVATGTREAEGAARVGAAPVRVTVIGTLPPVKGISPYTAQLLQGLAAQPDTEVDFVGFRSIYPRWLYPGGEPSERGARPPELPGVRVRNILTWYNPISWLRAGLTLKGDVVHAQWWSYALAHVYVVLLAIARLRGKRVVLTVHNVAPHEGGRARAFLNRFVMRFADAYIVHCEQNRDDLATALGRSPADVSVLPIGVARAEAATVDAAEARRALGLPAGSQTILCFGNIRPYKGVDVLLRAFAQVRENEPDAVLVIAGQPWEDWSRYDALIGELGVGKSVRLALDFIPTEDVGTYFAASDLAVLPYTAFDAQSAVGALSLSYGLPLVVTDAGGLPGLVRDPQAVVPANDATALANALTSVLHDGSLRERLAADSEQLARELGWDAIAAATVDTYRSAPVAEPVPEFLRRKEEPAAPAGNGSVPDFLRRDAGDATDAADGSLRVAHLPNRPIGTGERSMLELAAARRETGVDAPVYLPQHGQMADWAREAGTAETDRNVPETATRRAPRTALTPSVCAVIVNWNGFAHTVECIESLERQGYPDCRVVIIDNGSDHDEAQRLRERFPSVTIVENATNEGFGKACNRGVRVAAELGSAYVLLLNNDATVGSQTLRRLVDHDVIGGGPALWNPVIVYSGTDRIWFGGSWSNLWLGLQGHRHKGKRLSTRRSGAVSHATGCALFARTDTLLRLGPFDEDYFIYMEDYDLSYRAEQAGVRVRLADDAVVEHRKSATAGTEGSDRLTPVQTYHWGKGSALFARKHLRGLRKLAFTAGTLSFRFAQVAVLSKSPRGMTAYLAGVRDGFTAPLGVPSPREQHDTVGG